MVDDIDDYGSDEFSYLESWGYSRIASIALALSSRAPIHNASCWFTWNYTRYLVNKRKALGGEKIERAFDQI